MRNTLIGKATKGLAAFAAAALGVGLLTMPAANAADGNINLPDEKGSITVHKYEQGKGDWSSVARDGGEKKAPDGANALEGVEFTLYKAEGVDLEQQAAWDGIATATGSVNGTSGTATINGATKTLKQVGNPVNTDAEGVAKFSDLDLGLYYVVESGIGAHQITQKASPFFVTVPYPGDSSKGESWNYNVHVYPKNVVNEPGEKTADTTNTTRLRIDGTDNDLFVGDIVTWDIKQTVPANPNPNQAGEDLGVSQFGAVDPLIQYLALAPTGADNKSAVTIKVKKAGTTEEVDWTGDFTITQRDNIEKNGTTYTPWQINLTAVDVAGADPARKAVPGLAPNDQVIIKVRTKVTSLPSDGKIPNGFFPIQGDYDPFNDPNTPKDPENPPVKTKETPRFGDYIFNKIDKDSKQALSNAKFSIYKAEADTNKDGKLSAEEKAAATPVATNIASDANGVVSFKGIFLGNAPEETASLTANFFLVEDAAPAGYKVLADAKSITITQGTLTAPIEGADVPNEKSDVPQLPFTGAAGKLLLTIGGAAVIALAVGLYMVNARRNKKQA
ncbi:SpaH/EbpB family LPXTG-anchored major pilin [Arcanobacterium haemolyticum]|nr:SpaH/EbpB family LPXTG-anchored major pilin [Arcanobacterium haemolyticum]